MAKKEKEVIKEVEVQEEVVTGYSIKIVDVNTLQEVGEYQTKHSAAIDLVSAEDVTIFAGSRPPVKIKTGVRLLVEGEPPPFVGLLELRSSLRVKGFTSLGTGVIDADYKDEICVVVKATHDGMRINKGDRIAQILFLPILKADNNVKDVDRSGGFGST